MTVPELHKKPGLSYAFTDDGLELPVIDVTHPAFTIDDTELEARVEQFVVESRARR